MSSCSRNTSLLLFIFVLVVQATTITVPTHETSIQAAINRADDHDTIFIKAGTYNESIVLKENISLIGEVTSKVIIRGNRKEPVVRSANNTLIKNLTITHGKTGILCENAQGLIEHVFIRNNKGTGIHCLVTLPDIVNCVISQNKWSGIFCESTRSIKTAILHNVITENGYSGIMLQGQSEVLIQNNVFLDNKQYGIWGALEAKRSRVIYNVFFGNRQKVNLHITFDASNTEDNPGYLLLGHEYDFSKTENTTLKGRGKDGATIGLISAESLNQKMNDPDGDGIPSDKDLCPDIAEDQDNFEDSDGCPEFDNDNDGLYDTQDACLNDAEDFDGFKDNDGCPDPDNDADGIPDSIDICIMSSETINGFKDDDGCPDEVPAGKEALLLPKTVHVTAAGDSTLSVKKQVAHDSILTTEHSTTVTSNKTKPVHLPQDSSANLPVKSDSVSAPQ